MSLFKAHLTLVFIEKCNAQYENNSLLTNTQRRPIDRPDKSVSAANDVGGKIRYFIKYLKYVIKRTMRFSLQLAVLRLLVYSNCVLRGSVAVKTSACQENPGWNPLGAVSKLWQFIFPHVSAVHSAERMGTWLYTEMDIRIIFFRAVIGAWLNSSQRSRDNVGMNRCFSV